MDWRRWKFPLLGLVIATLGFDIQFFLPRGLQVVGALLIGAGVSLMHRRLRRSMAENSFRLFFGWLLVHILLFLANQPSFRDAKLLWGLAFALVLGVVGTAIPRPTRKKIYGLTLAAFWVVLIGGTIDSSQVGLVDEVWASSGAAFVLLLPTFVYMRWMKTGDLPRLIDRWYWALPDDESEGPILDSLTSGELNLPEPRLQISSEERNSLRP